MRVVATGLNFAIIFVSIGFFLGALVGITYIGYAHYKTRKANKGYDKAERKEDAIEILKMQMLAQELLTFVVMQIVINSSTYWSFTQISISPSTSETIMETAMALLMVLMLIFNFGRKMEKYYINILVLRTCNGFLFFVNAFLLYCIESKTTITILGATFIP